MHQPTCCGQNWLAKMVRILLDNYEVDEHVAEADVKELVAKWKKEGIIEA